jgi:hypothetical protein
MELYGGGICASINFDFAEMQAQFLGGGENTQNF